MVVAFKVWLPWIFWFKVVIKSEYGEWVGQNQSTKDHLCEACIKGKQHRQSFPVGRSWRARRPLELVHTYIVGPYTYLHSVKTCTT